MRFSVCMIEPPEYRFSHFLYDSCKYICYTIEALGHDCSIVRNTLYDKCINIILGSHNLNDPAVVEAFRQRGEYVIVQTEVFKENGLSGWSSNDSCRHVYVPLMRQARAVWDVLESNQNFLHNMGIKAVILPRFGYLPGLKEIIHKENKDIDFLYYGSLTPHRKEMISRLKQRGARVVCLFDEAAIFRNDYIARTRIHLVPNQTPENNHITGRVLYLLNNKSVVVVEYCRDQEWIEHCCLSAPTEEWADLCMETLHRPDLDQLADQFFERYKKLDMTPLFRPLLENLEAKITAGDRNVFIAKPLSRISHLLSESAQSSVDQGQSVGQESVARLDALLKTSPTDSFSAQSSRGHEHLSPSLSLGQYFVSAPLFKEKTISGLTSIIILPHNRLDQTKKGLKSIRKHTPEAHEIIFVDNGSKDDTVKWLKRQVPENNNWRLIENKEEPGFAKAVNQGIKASQGEFILLLNSDVVVAEGWLSRMLECLNSGSDVGIVGPMTNQIAGPQQVVSDEYRSVDYLDKYAEKFRERYRHRRILHRTISGFCMLFKRTLAERIGLLDESFGTGNFEDEDFCLRAALEGYGNLIAGDVFVHHYGDRSLADNKIDSRPAVSGNRKIMDEKWTLSFESPLGKQLAVLKATETAVELYQKGLFEKAVEALIDCIKISPDAKEIYYELARIFIESKRFTEAFEVVESMPEPARDDLRGLECAGYCKEGLGLDGDANAYAEMMLSLDPGYAPAINLKGILAYKKEDMQTAHDYFKKALNSDPGYGEAHTNLGVLKWTAGKVDEALGHLSKGFILSSAVPDHSALYYSVVSSSGTHADAEVLFRDAKGLYPNNKNIIYLYIDTLIQQGKFRSAIAEIEDAIVSFGLDDGILNAALSVREQVGPPSLEKKDSKEGTLSLCMIVKNEEEHLAKCLTSVRPIVDEMIVVDTGSTDRTKEIAQAFGAQVFEFPWTGDFAAARNYSLSKTTGDWVLILDADEVLSPLDFKALAETTGTRPKSPVAYTIVTRNYLTDVRAMGWMPNNGQYPEEAGTGWVPSPKVRLFTRDGRIVFTDPVHETLEASLNSAGIPVKPCGVVVHHYGKLIRKRQVEKGEHYYELGKQKLEKDPNNLKSIQELATQAQQLQHYEEATELWQKGISLTPEQPVGLFYFNLGYCYMMLEQYEKAIEASRRAMELDPNIKESALNYANCEIIAGSLEQALAVLNGILGKMSDYPPAVLLVAVIFCVQGKSQEMQDLFKKLLQKGFNITNAMNRMAKQMLSQRKEGDALALLTAAIQNGISDQETIELIGIVQKTMQHENSAFLS